MPVFVRKTDKSKLFEKLLVRNSKHHNRLTEEDKVHCFHSFMRGDTLQTAQAPTRKNWARLQLCSVEDTSNPCQG